MTVRTTGATLGATMCTGHTTTAEEDRATLTRRAALVGGGAAALTALLPGTAGAARPPDRGRRGRRLQDLTHELTVDFPVFAAGEEPSKRPGRTFERDGYSIQEWTLFEHTATHVDAPGHFVPGGRLAPQLTLEELVVPAAVVDIAARAAADPDTVVTVDDLRAHERRHGRIPRGGLVLMHSGWQARLAEPGAYRNADAEGVLHFPGFDPEAADWLVRRRDVAGIGVDTLSLDPGNSTTFGTHLGVLGADRYGIENVANLDRVPPSGAEVTVGLIPWQDGSGGPARVLARW